MKRISVAVRDGVFERDAVTVGKGRDKSSLAYPYALPHFGTLVTQDSLGYTWIGNCHERRIDYEADLCRRCMKLLESGIWQFKGVTKIFDMKDFDKVSEMMENHTDNFIKGAFRC